MRFPGFIGPSYTLQSVNIDCQRTVNLFPELNALGTGKEREVAALVPTPGLRLLLTLGESPVRGLHCAADGTTYAVAGTKMYSISSSWVASELGSLNTSTGHVSIEDNGAHVFVVDGSYGYTWTIATSTFAVVSDPDFYASKTVTFQDGYLIFVKPYSQQFFFTDITAVTFDALDIGTAEARPDYLVGCISANQNLYLFGTKTTEVFYNSGDGNAPFARIQGAVSGVGCIAPHSIRSLNGVPYWLGNDHTIYRMNGYQAERVSTPAIEAVIRSISSDDQADSRAWVYSQGGHAFYCINLPGDDTTWVYDQTTGLWHERQYLNLWSLERHRADCSAYAYGLNIVGDYETGAIYALDPDVYTDNGTSISRIRTAPHISQNAHRLFHNSFELDMETGVGLDGTGQGTDPQVMLQYSDDGGHTWSGERWKSCGAIGETKTRVRWNRLGSSYDRVYRVKVTDPVKVVLIGADIVIEEGAA